MKKWGLIFLIACMLTLSFSSVQAGYIMTDGYFTYVLENGSLEIKSVSTAISGSVTLTSRVAGYPVTSVGPGAFQKCVQLNELSLPESITNISINAFQGCIKLRAIHIAVENPVYFDDQGVLYTQNKLLLCPPAYSGKLTVPASITEISEKAAEGCSALTEVSFPDTLSKIGRYAFSDCTALTKALLPEAALYIGEYTFNNCIVLTETHISDIMKHIPNGLFYNCTALGYISFPSALKSVGDYSFYGTDLWVLRLPESVGKLGKGAFQKSSLTELYFPAALECISDSAFAECKKLKKLKLPQSIREIEDNAFRGCYYLEEVDIPNSVKKLGNRVFMGCGLLKGVTLPQSIPTIGYQLFSGCSRLNGIIFPDKLKEIGSGAFFNCSSLQSIVIPETVERIGKSAFQGCTTLKNITLPPLLTCIAGDLFRDCKNLSSIDLPFHIKKIGENAFRSAGLTEISFPYGLQSIEAGAFIENKLTTISIPDTVTSLGSEAFRDCKSLKSAWIPYSVTEIGAFLFGGIYKPVIYCDVYDSFHIRYRLKKHFNDNSQYTYIPSSWHVAPDYIGQKLNVPEVPARNGYTIVGWYQDKNFSQEWNFEDDTVKSEMTLYARWGISPGKIMMTGGEFPSSATSAFKKEIRYRLPENTNGLNITLRYDASAVLYQSIEPKDFRYCFVSGPFEDPQNPGFMLLSIICKYNDTGSVSGELDVNPFNLNFKLLRSASYTQTVDFVQDSPDSLYAISEDGVPLSFTYIENGIVWNTTDGYASYFTINGESVISSPTSYNTTLYPARPPKEPSVLWSVSDPSTATIDSNGLLTPLKDGSVILTAQTTDGSGFSAAKMITIGSEGPEPKLDGIFVGTLFSVFSSDIYNYQLNYYSYFDHGLISFRVEFDDGLQVYTKGSTISQSGYVDIVDCDSPYVSVNNGQRSVTYHFPYNYNSNVTDASPPPLHLSMYMGEYAVLYNFTSGWTSKNKDIATVDQSGVVHATGVGRAILTHPNGWECRVDIETSGLDYTLKNPRAENGSLMVALQNDTQRRAQDTLIAAFYDADGRLMHMNAQKLTSDMVGEISAGTVPADLPCIYSKIFVWEGADAPTPLSNAAVLRELQTE